MSIRVRSVPRATLAVAGVVIAACAMTGCTEPGDGTPTTSPSVSAAESESAGPSVSPSASALPETATPIDQTCLELVPLQTMYDFDPNFGLQDPFTPVTGSLGEAAVDAEGVACGWIQQTNGEKLEIDVAAPAATDLAARKSDAGETNDGRSFFTTAGETGVVQIFEGRYWIVLSSTYFSGPADAAALADSVTAALP
ncbi:MAG: hypothetical protein RI885_893 [Actinomycetota bacterium]|jgi:hypothetical protein